MSINLVVPSGATMDLESEAAPEVRACLRGLKIEKLDDLVAHSLIRSHASIERLLNAAQNATRAAFNDRTPSPRVPGTLRRLDLARWQQFVAESAGISRAETETFWRVAREISPTILLAGITPNTNLTNIRRFPFLVLIWQFLDVTIEKQATLKIGKHLNCGHLLIKKTGKLILSGAGTHIWAVSIEGNQ